MWGYLAYLPVLRNTGVLTLGQVEEPLWTGFFWMVTAAGAATARAGMQSRFTIGWLALLLALLGAYFGVKFVFVARGLFIEAFPVLHMLILAICLLTVKTLCDPALVGAVMKRSGLIGAAIAVTSGLTLELHVT